MLLIDFILNYNLFINESIMIIIDLYDFILEKRKKVIEVLSALLRKIIKFAIYTEFHIRASN